MSRLPNPGADQGVWGDILNDFLLEEHQLDGSLKIRTDGTIEPAISYGASDQYWRGDKTWQLLNKNVVGLNQVDNTSDIDKPVSTAMQSALSTKADDASVVHRAGDSMSGDLTLPSGVSVTFNGPKQYLRWDPGEGLWLAIADDNKTLKLSYGGGTGKMVIDQYGFGEVARFSNGTLSMRSHSIKDVANPEDAQDVATKSYVDAGVAAIVTKSANYSLTPVDHTVLANASGGALTLTLPSAGALTGKTYTLKKIDGSGNAVTIATSGSQTIDGNPDFVLPAAWRYITVQSDGVNWFIIAEN